MAQGQKIYQNLEILLNKLVDSIQAVLLAGRYYLGGDCEGFEDEKSALIRVMVPAFDFGQIHSLRARNQFRERLESNRYSVPADYARQPVILKAYLDLLYIYHHEQMVARHPRSYDRHQDFELPDHPRELLAQRRHA